MKINQMEPWIGVEERQAMDEYLASGGWLTEFQKTAQFADMIAEYVGSAHAIITVNGTVSLFVAMAAFDIGPGDEIIVPDYSMIATANAVILTGAVPVFVDVDPQTLCLDLDQVESAITDRTKAMMVVSINGRAPDMDRIHEIGEQYGVSVIEDAAQSLGARWHGHHLGTFGAIGSFSFSSPKIITTGQGGALVTDDPHLAQKIRRIRDFGRDSGGIDHHESIGYNFKFTDLQAVIGIEQMKKLDWRVQRKKAIFALYQTLLDNIEEITFLPTDLEEVPPWFIDILCPDPASLQAYLAENDIGARPFYPPIHSQPAYGQSGFFPNTEYASEHGLWLPSSSFLEDDSIEHICKVIRRFFYA